MGSTRKLCLAALIAVVALGLAAVTGPASAGKPARAGKALGKPAPPGKGKGKNPLRGSWAGTNEEGGTVSFRIAQSGKVSGFVAGPTTVVCPQPLAPDPITGILGYVPPTVLTTTATVFPDGPIRLNKEVPGYPKGKRFDYYDPGGDPHGNYVAIAGTLPAKGSRGNRRMKGFFYLKYVRDPHSGRDTCRMRGDGELGGFGIVSWDARKVGK